MLREKMSVGLVVAHNPKAKWRAEPELTRAVRIVDLGPFGTGFTQEPLEVDGETKVTSFRRCDRGVFVAVRPVTPDPTGATPVELVNAVRLLMPWAEWGEVQAELDAARELAEGIRRQERAELTERRKAVQADLARAGVTVSIWTDFTEDDQVRLTFAQVARLTRFVPVRRPSALAPRG